MADDSTQSRSPAAARSEEREQALNPHRDEDRSHAADMAYAQLRQRGVRVTGDEPAEELAQLVEAVERFELAVSAVGGDRMTNAPDSTDPDDRRLVLPERNEGEGAGAYAERVDVQAARIMERAPAEMRARGGHGAGDAALGGLAADAQG
jgi:hypothetical protein